MNPAGSARLASVCIHPPWERQNSDLPHRDACRGLGVAVELGPRPPGAKTFPIDIRAEAIAVFFKTARNADRLIEGLQAQKCNR